VSGLIGADDRPMREGADEAAVFDCLEPPKARALVMAGVECFADLGFDGTTTRDIAERVDLSPAAVYVHFPSKADLLFTISKLGHESALQTLEAAAASEPPGTERIGAMISAFAAWHARNRRLAKVVQYELDAIPPERRPELNRMRRRFETVFESTIEEGIEANLLTAPDVAGAAMAILSLCIDVARWYSPQGPRSPESLGRFYADLLLRMLNAAPATA